MIPAPPATPSSAKTRRTRVASTPSLAATPPHTPASTRSVSLRSKRGAGTASASGAYHVDLAGADGRLDLQRARPGVDGGVAPIVVAAERVNVADLGARVDADVGAARNDDQQIADADLRLDAQRLVDPHVRQVDVQLPDAERVRGLHGGGGRGRVVMVPDTVAEADVEPCEHRDHDGD